MEYCIGCDAPKRYSVFLIRDPEGSFSRPIRVEHDRRTMRSFLEQIPAGIAVGLETSGHWYWLVDEIERAGLRPRLGHALVRISHQRSAGVEANARHLRCRGAIHRARSPTDCTLSNVHEVLPRAKAPGLFASFTAVVVRNAG